MFVSCSPRNTLERSSSSTRFDSSCGESNKKSRWNRLWSLSSLSMCEIRWPWKARSYGEGIFLACRECEAAACWLVDANKSCLSRASPASSNAGLKALATITASQHVKVNQMWCPGGPSTVPFIQPEAKEPESKEFSPKVQQHKKCLNNSSREMP